MKAEAVYLAIDLGAGSGRVMAGLIDGEAMRLEEVDRFENRVVEVDGKLSWDFECLWAGVVKGLRMAVGKYGAERIVSVGVDAWGVDYGLLGNDGRLLASPRNHRDPRTGGMMEAFLKRLPAEDVYEETGIQFLDINTLPQMCAEVADGSLIENAGMFLLMPDLVNYRLSGRAVCERTNASTTQMYHPGRGEWSEKVFDAAGLPMNLAPVLTDAGEVLGEVLPEVAEATGLSRETNVVAVGSHDTASAVAAVPAEKGQRFAYLSSGTWSLLGVELDEPVLTPLAREYNFTNEVGVFETVRLLKNINGMWLVQECRRVWREEGNDWSYLELAEMAKGAGRFQAMIDPDDERFTRRCEMPRVIADYCRESGQNVPASPGEILRLVIDSLALKVRFVLERLEKVIGERIEVLHIIGGGGQNEALNQSIASSINRPVLVGPYEATAAGNVMMQVCADGGLEGLEAGRAMIRRSSKTRSFTPAHPKEWTAAYARFLTLMG